MPFSKIWAVRHLRYPVVNVIKKKRNACIREPQGFHRNCTEQLHSSLLMFAVSLLHNGSDHSRSHSASFEASDIFQFNCQNPIWFSNLFLHAKPLTYLGMECHILSPLPCTRTTTQLENKLISDVSEVFCLPYLLTAFFSSHFSLTF